MELLKKDCSFCYPSDRYDYLNIGKVGNFRICLNENQTYLGRSLIILDGLHASDITDIPIEKYIEGDFLIRNYGNLIMDIFEAKEVDYLSLGNVVPHFHWHVIPRHNKPIVFDNVIFDSTKSGSIENEGYGFNEKIYTPYDKEFVIPKETTFKIIQNIGKRLPELENEMKTFRKSL